MITTTNSYITYVSNGTTKSYTFNFPVTQATDINVYVYDLNNNKTQLVYGTTYMVTLTYGSGDTVSPIGGTVTLATAPPSNYQILIQRNVAYTQLTEYPENSPFPSSSHEAALDKLTILTQQLQSGLSEAMVADPVSGWSGYTNLPASVAPTPNAVPQANASGKINRGWLPINPTVSINSNITLNGTSDSGNIYLIYGLTSNITITLPTAVAGYNYTFIGANATSYTVTFSNGTLLFNGTSQSSLTLDLSGKNAYKFICDGTNWFVNIGPSYGVSPTPTANQIPVANASGVLNVSALTLLTNARQTAVFTQNGTWTVPAGVTTIYVSGCGGGAGGGAGTSSNGGLSYTAGQSTLLQPISVTAGSILTITIGAAGTYNGGAGGTTTLAVGSTTLLTLSGGGGNFYQVGTNSSYYYYGAPGCSTPFGIGGYGGINNINGGNASGYGASGGGGQGGGTLYAGGNGAQGILIIQW